LGESSYSKELFFKIMNFEPCNRTLKWEFGYWGGTLKRWYQEGLPVISGLPQEVTYGETIVGPGCPSGMLFLDKNFIIDSDVFNYFNFDAGFNVLPYNYWIFPPFEQKIIVENEEYVELIDSDGIRKRVLKNDSSMPLWLDWPVKNKKDWERIKEERFNPGSICKRYSENFLKITKENDASLLSMFYHPVGFFGSLRFLLGESKLFFLYYDDPLFLKEILNHLCNLWISIAEEILSKTNIDIAIFWEDMSGKNGSLISPGMFKEFMSPYYGRLISFLKLKGVKYFAVDTDGKVDQLIPLFLDIGVNILFPFEQQADNNLLNLRVKYPDLRMLGGIDKNILYKGKEYIDKELEKVSGLIKSGGYIPFCDHLIPPNSSWQNFKYYRNELNRIIDHNEVL
jgi:hypothetical protein